LSISDSDDENAEYGSPDGDGAEQNGISRPAGGNTEGEGLELSKREKRMALGKILSPK
jgi:hypothetical protein